MFRGNPVAVFQVHKNFIVNNSEKIFTAGKLRKLGYEKSFKLFQNSKRIFLIDLSEKEGNEIIVKEVFLTYTGIE